MYFDNDDFFNYFYGNGNDYFEYGQEPVKQGMGTQEILLIALGCSILAAAILLITVFKRKNEGRFHGFMEKIYNFMNLNHFYAEDIIRYLNIVTVCALIGVGVTMCFTVDVWYGLAVVVIGNIFARLAYELLLMFIIMVKKSVSADKRLKDMDRRLEGIEVYLSDDMEEWNDDYDDEAGCDGNCGGCSFDCGPEALIKPNIIYGEGPVAEPESFDETQVSEETSEDSH